MATTKTRRNAPLRSPFELKWPVHRDEYEWVDLKPNVEVLKSSGYQWTSDLRGRHVIRCLVARIEHGPVRYYHPMGDSTLFIKATEVNVDSPEDILRFANEFGVLGAGSCHLASGGRGSYSEPLDNWIEELRTLQIAKSIWDSLRTKNRNELRRYIEWTEERGMRWNHPLSIPFLGDADPLRNAGPYPLAADPAERNGDRSSDPFASLKPRDISALGWETVFACLNHKLFGEIAPQLLASTRRGECRLAFSPKSLRAALWLQMAKALEGRGEYDRCTLCNKWFAIECKPRGVIRQYCSPACRQKALRRRRQES